MWRKLRIAILLFILATVAHRSWLEANDREWKSSFYVAVYPVNFDGSEASAGYIAGLRQEKLESISEYFAEESVRYGLKVARPFELRLGPGVGSLPPQAPKGGNVLQNIFWSLHFRWWAWRHSPRVIVKPDVKLYLLFHDPAQNPILPHSSALNKGRIGLVNVFASRLYERQNNVVIAHELLHTFGATDKYSLADNLPAYPEGYAEPEKQPLYPQEFAELMAGRVPISESRAEIPDSLAKTLVGDITAIEIGWTNQAAR